MADITLKIKAWRPKEPPYRVGIGGSHFVVVHPSGGKSWKLSYRRGEKTHAFVLGLNAANSQMGTQAITPPLCFHDRALRDPSFANRHRYHVAVDRHTSVPSP